MTTCSTNHVWEVGYVLKGIMKMKVYSIKYNIGNYLMIKIIKGLVLLHIKLPQLLKSISEPTGIFGDMVSDKFCCAYTGPFDQNTITIVIANFYFWSYNSYSQIWG